MTEAGVDEVDNGNAIKVYPSEKSTHLLSYSFLHV